MNNLKAKHLGLDRFLSKSGFHTKTEHFFLKVKLLINFTFKKLNCAHKNVFTEERKSNCFVLCFLIHLLFLLTCLNCLLNFRTFVWNNIPRPGSPCFKHIHFPQPINTIYFHCSELAGYLTFILYKMYKNIQWPWVYKTGILSFPTFFVCI